MLTRAHLEAAAELPDGDASAKRSATGFRLPPEGVDWEMVEADALRQACERARGNVRAAARLLGLSYDAFRYRLHKHGIDGRAEPVATGSHPRGPA